MRFKVVTTDIAENDMLERIIFVGQRDPEFADGLSVKFIHAIRTLSFMPSRHKPGYVLGTRELLSVENYAIIFRVIEDKNLVEVLHVYHQAQER